ncbi:ABC transporter permease [Romboutsia lituseburensis]|nr:ABC transporter permease [Romboutsia lituseburensis]MCR8746345.1 ABC transporter permease [Romboutsia lituseburensis]
MGGNVLKKLIQLVGVMFLLSIVVFYMSRLAPGDPLKSYYGETVERMSIHERENALDKLGLNEPIYIQYGKWVSNCSKGDFGISFKYKQPVITVIKDAYINTLILGGLGYIFTFVLALILGIFCALHEDKIIDRFICKLGTITNCIPSFWVSLVLILIFSINLGILPTSGAYSMGKENDIYNRITHLILPITVLILSHLWYYTYMIRNKLLDEVREDYVLLCKAKGLHEKSIIYKHCLRNIMPTYISIMAISVPHILGGTYIVEQVFSYPGLGSLCFESAKYHDYNMLLILSLITGILVVVSNMVAQIINNKIDPRMKHNRGENSEIAM